MSDQKIPGGASGTTTDAAAILRRRYITTAQREASVALEKWIAELEEMRERTPIRVTCVTEDQEDHEFFFANMTPQEAKLLIDFAIGVIRETETPPSDL